MWRIPDFFGYTNVPDAEVLELMETNAFNYMIESISMIETYAEPEVDFNDYNTTTDEFNFELTKKEIQMLTNLMVQQHLYRDIMKLKIYNSYFTTQEVRIFSPANDRKTFVDMFRDIEDRNIKEIKSYNSRDRLTGSLKSYSGVV